MSATDVHWLPFHGMRGARWTQTYCRTEIGQDRWQRGDKRLLKVTCGACLVKATAALKEMRAANV